MSARWSVRRAASRLFRRHVPRSAGRLAFGQTNVRFILVHHLGDAEVGDLDPAVFVEQQVLRLDVAMDDAVGVRVLQRLADRRHDGQRLLRSETPGLHRLAQVHAVDEFHEQVVKPAGLAEVMDRHDVRMAQLRERLGFAGESFGKCRVVAALGRQQLERHHTVERPSGAPGRPRPCHLGRGTRPISSCGKLAASSSGWGTGRGGTTPGAPVGSATASSNARGSSPCGRSGE